MYNSGQKSAFAFLFLVFGRRILIPQPRTELMPPAVEAWSLNHWTAREVLAFAFLRILFLR